MESAFGSKLKKLILRIALYALGLVVILAIVIGIIFTLAKPKIMTFAKNEMHKHGIEARDVDINLLGKVIMHDVSLPFNEGRAHIDTLNARPPLHFWGRTWVGSNGSLYNLNLSKDGAYVFIPEMQFSGVALEDKNPKIASHNLQFLDRLRIGDIFANEIKVAVTPDFFKSKIKKLTNLKDTDINATVKGFSVQGVKHGKIADIAYSSIVTNTQLPDVLSLKDNNPVTSSLNDKEQSKNNDSKVNGEAKKVNAQIQLGDFSSNDLDLSALYILAKSIAPKVQNNDIKDSDLGLYNLRNVLIGGVNQQNINVVFQDAKIGVIKAKIDKVASKGLTLKDSKALANLISKKALSSDTSESELDDKHAMLHNIQQFLAQLSALDIVMRDLHLDVNLHKNIISSDTSDDVLEQTEEDAKETADRIAEEPDTTISDILKEEREDKLAAKEQKRLRKRAKHLPRQFQLSVGAFQVSVDDWKNVIPYDFHIGLENLVYNPGMTDNPVILSLQQMIGQKLKVSLLIDAKWNKNTSSLAINNFVVYDPDLGGFSVKSDILDVPESFFAGKTKFIDVILQDAAIKQLDVLFQDKGFMQKIVQWITTQVDVSTQELEEDLHDIAVKSPPLLLKNHQEAQNFSNQFGAFVQQSGNLRIKMSAPSNGLKMNDIMTSSYNLSDLLNKLRLSVDRPSSVLLTQ